jgi:hypothetical protein
MGGEMKALAVISLAIATGVAIYEGTMWFGKSDLAIVIIALAVAIMFQSAYSLTKKYG